MVLLVGLLTNGELERVW